jgi:transposase
MTASIPIDNLIRSLPFPQAEWDLTLRTVQAHLAALDTTVSTLEAQLQQLQQQVDQLQGRLDQTTSPSSKPPSSDSPFKKRKPRHSLGQHGGQPGHPGADPKLLEPTEVEVVLPPSWSCGHAVMSAPMPYRTP